MSSSLGFGPGGAGRFARTPGRMADGAGMVRYPSPFFDIASTYMPSSFKTMLKWCRFYFFSNPLINAVVYKMAEYPVTDLVFDTDNEHLKDQWTNFFTKVIQFKRFEVEAGLDEGAYGNCFISIFFPFVKYLSCRRCDRYERVDRVRYTFRDFKFHGECPFCRAQGDFKVVDRNIRSVNDIRLIRWDPEQISIQHNPATGESLYYYTVPASLANDIRMAKRHVIERIPQMFIDALKQNKSLLFDRNNIYHLKRATIAQKDKGWGLPMILPVLRDTFYLQILRKAQEAISLEHIVPLRILFPQSASGTSDVYCVSLDSWVETRDGPKRASFVKEGDALKSRTGKWEVVEVIKDRALAAGESAYEFTVEGLSAFPFTLSEEHPVWAIKQTPYLAELSEMGWQTPNNLEEGDYVLYPIAREINWDLTLDLSLYIKSKAHTDTFIYQTMTKGAALIYEYIETYGFPERHPAAGHDADLTARGWTLEDYLAAKEIIVSRRAPDRIRRYIPITKDLAYVIGAYARSGYMTDDGVSIPHHCKEELDGAVRRLGFQVKNTCVHRTDGSSIQYTVYDPLLAEFLAWACNVQPSDKQIPRFILESPAHIAIYAFFGVAKGAVPAKWMFAHKTWSMSLVVGLRSILLSNECVPDITRKDPDYTITLSSMETNRLLRQYGLPSLFQFDDPAKMVPARFHNGFVCLRIKKKTKRHVDTVRGFQMGGDRTFCVVGVATHNSTINLQGWKQKVESEIMRWRIDNSYVPILPLPMGQQTLGAEGRALMLSQEYRVWAEHIVAGMGVPTEFVFGGLCIDSNTLVVTNQGLMPMRDITPKKAETTYLTHDLSVPTEKGAKKVTHAHNVGHKESWRLRTHFGYELRAAPTHPVWSLQSDLSLRYVNLEDLKVGDYVVRLRHSNLWPTVEYELKDWVETINSTDLPKEGRAGESYPKTMTASFARLVGFILGSGSVTPEGIQFSTMLSDVAHVFIDTLEETFGVRPRVYRHRTTGKWCYEVSYWSSKLAASLMKIGLDDGPLHEAHIPVAVLRSPKRVVVEFLRAYLEGKANLRRSSETVGGIRVRSRSTHVLREVQLLLSNMGFQPYVLQDANGHWFLELVSGLRSFEKDIGLISNRKKTILSVLQDSDRVDQRVPYVKDALRAFESKHPSAVSKGRRTFGLDLPAGDRLNLLECAEIIGSHIKPLLKDIETGKFTAERRAGVWLVTPAELQRYCKEVGVRRVDDRTWPRFKPSELELTEIRSIDMSRVIEKEPELYKRLMRVCEGDLVFDEVVALEDEYDLIPMSDLTVTDEHCYVAGGIVCHNSYSGSNVSMRMLENHFLGQKGDHHALAEWIMHQVGPYMGWQPVPHHFKRFKMADDLQRAAYHLQLNQAGKLSDRSLLEETDWDSDFEAERIVYEQKKVFESQRQQALSQAQIQGEAQLTMQKYQIRAQKLMNESMPPPPGMEGLAQEASQMVAGQPQLAEEPQVAQPPQEAPQSLPGESRLTFDSNMGADPNNPLSLVTSPGLHDIAKRIAAHLDQMSDAEKQSHVIKLRQTNPQLYSLVAMFMQQRAGAHRPSSAMPQPIQKPPRRGPESIA